jgi:hypothetical protein
VTCYGHAIANVREERHSHRNFSQYECTTLQDRLQPGRDAVKFISQTAIPELRPAEI